MKVLYRFVLYIIMFFIVYIPLCGCTEKDDSHEFISYSGSYRSDTNQVAQEVKKLYENPDMDIAVMSVNGYEITRRDIEYQKIHRQTWTDNDTKKLIKKLIESLAIKSEAIRLNIEPNEDELNNHLMQNQVAFDSGAAGTDLIYAYMDALNMTYKQYQDKFEYPVAYETFQKDAYRNFIESEGKNFKNHIKKLVKKANIKFFDSELEKIYKD